jgi:hypothetical protein
MILVKLWDTFSSSTMRLVILQVPGPRGIWQGNLVLAIFAGIV